MNLGVLLSALGIALAGCGLAQRHCLTCVLCCYAGFSCLALGLAYLLNRPQVLMKRADGRFPLLGWLLYLPYHLHNHLFLEVFRRTSSKPRWTEIVPGLWIGGRMRPSDEARLQSANFQSVLDVTGEFSEVKWLRAVPHYLCIPLLDITAPTLDQLRDGVAFIREGMTRGAVYAHCAFGHSRSATFVAGYLLASGQCRTVDEAIALVQAKRPRVRLNPPQLAALRQGFPASSITP